MLEFLVKRPAEGGERGPVLVLLHGRGSDMADLQGLAPLLPARSTLVTPQAPHRGAPWGYGPGWAWYRFLGEGLVDAESLARSLTALHGFLEELTGSLGFRPDPLVLGGFSQGGTTSLAYALEHPGSVAGVVVLSGFLAKRESLGVGPDAFGETPLFWAHGTHDPAVPYSLALEGRERIRKAGGRLEARDYPIGHWVIPEEMSDLRSWLEKSIPGWKS